MHLPEDRALELLEHARAEFDPVTVERVLVPIDGVIERPMELIPAVMDALQTGSINDEQGDMVMERIRELAHAQRLAEVIANGELQYESVGNQDHLVFEFVADK